MRAVTAEGGGGPAGSFSTVFDGVAADDPDGKWAADEAMTDLRNTRVIDQQMAGCGGGRWTTGRF